MFIPTPDRKERLLKYALIGLGAALVLAMFSALYFGAKPPVPSGQEKVEQETVLTPETELKLQEQVAPLIKGGDMAACDQVQNDMYKKVCINNIALKKAEETGDISYCRYLDDELIPKETCERQVILKKSVTEGTATACAETTNASLRQECENSLPIRLALEKNDPSFCDRAENPEKCKDILALGNFSTDPKNIDCTAFSTEDIRTDCSSLKPLFLSEAPDLSAFTKACENVKSQVFTHVCANAVPAAPEQQ